jgi:hypothetical protein
MPWFVFVFLVFFVAARRQKVRGERLEVIGPIRISVSRFLLSPVSSFPPPPPSRHFAPFAVKMYSFVFVFLVFFAAMPWSVLRLLCLLWLLGGW